MTLSRTQVAAALTPLEQNVVRLAARYGAGRAELIVRDVDVPAKNVPKFKAASTLKEAVA